LEHVLEPAFPDGGLDLIPILLGEVLPRPLPFVDLGILALNLLILHAQKFEYARHLPLIVLIEILVVKTQVSAGTVVRVEQVGGGLGLSGLLPEEFDNLLNLLS